MASTFRIIFDTLTKLLWLNTVDPAPRVVSTLEALAQEIQAAAQSDAPWSDRTGEARAGLEASVNREGDVVSIDLYHTVDYGQWLETIQSGRFAIIMPTLEAYADRVMEAVNAERKSG